MLSEWPTCFHFNIHIYHVDALKSVFAWKHNFCIYLWEPLKILQGARVGGTRKWVRDAATETPIKPQNMRCDFQLRIVSYNMLWMGVIECTLIDWRIIL